MEALFEWLVEIIRTAATILVYAVISVVIIALYIGIQELLS